MVKDNRSSTKKDQENEDRQQSSKALTREGQSRTGMGRREQTGWPGSPFTFMRRFSEEMDRLFDDFGFGGSLFAPGFERGLSQMGTFGGGAWAPQVEVLERNNQLIIRADLPGMTKDDITVDVDDDSLIIRGERKSEREENEEGYYRSERSYGSFYRQIPLPTGVNANEAKADFRNGVLEITMPAPKRAEEKRRQIQISGETQEQPRASAKGAGES